MVQSYSATDDQRRCNHAFEVRCGRREGSCSAYGLTVVADISWTVRRYLSKLGPAKAEAEVQAVVADSMQVARLENSGMQRVMRMISDIMPTALNL